MVDRPSAIRGRLDAISKAEAALATERASLIKQAANRERGWTQRRVATFLKANPEVAQRLDNLTKAGKDKEALALQVDIVKAVEAAAPRPPHRLAVGDPGRDRPGCQQKHHGRQRPAQEGA